MSSSPGRQLLSNSKQIEHFHFQPIFAKDRLCFTPGLPPGYPKGVALIGKSARPEPTVLQIQIFAKDRLCFTPGLPPGYPKGVALIGKSARPEPTDTVKITDTDISQICNS